VDAGGMKRGGANDRLVLRSTVAFGSNAGNGISAKAKGRLCILK